MKGAPQPPEVNFFGYTSSKLESLSDKVMDDDITGLRNQIADGFTGYFDRRTKNEKKVYVAICGLADTELRALVDLPPDTLIIEDKTIRNHLTVLLSILPGFAERCGYEK